MLSIVECGPCILIGDKVFYIWLATIADLGALLILLILPLLMFTNFTMVVAIENACCDFE